MDRWKKKHLKETRIDTVKVIRKIREGK